MKHPEVLKRTLQAFLARIFIVTSNQNKLAQYHLYFRKLDTN